MGPASAAAATVRNGRISFLTNIDGYDRIGTTKLNGADTRIAKIKNGYSDFFAGDTPEWSADGSVVLFLTNTGGNSRVRTMRADTGGIQDHGTISGDTAITWTPEGNVAWITASGLWEAPLDALATPTLVAPGITPYQTDFSPDGTTIAYSRYSSDDFTYHVFTANRDGTGEVQVTTGSPGQFEPKWSPDGSQIVYRRGEFGGGPIQIQTMNPDGSGDTALTSVGRNYGAVWAPDGTRIAFSSSRTRGVWVMNPDGSDQHLEATGLKYDLDWQPAHATVHSSRTQVVFGDSINVSAHTPGGQTAGMLTIYRIVAGTDTLKKLYEAAPDPTGSASLTFAPNATATYYAVWAGDGVDPGGWSDLAATRVKVIVTAETRGGYATKGGVRLYHYTNACPNSGTGCPITVFTLTPAHPEGRLTVTLQVRVNGSWRTVDSRRWRLRHGKSLKLVFVYADTSIIGRSYRAMGEFPSDLDHIGDASPWLPFRVTT